MKLRLLSSYSYIHKNKQLKISLLSWRSKPSMVYCKGNYVAVAPMNKKIMTRTNWCNRKLTKECWWDSAFKNYFSFFRFVSVKTYHTLYTILLSLITTLYHTIYYIILYNSSLNKTIFDELTKSSHSWQINMSSNSTSGQIES